MYIIGHGRKARESYPKANQGGAAVIALQNRAISPAQALDAFTPATGPSFSLLGAILVTPKASGIFMVATNIIIGQPAATDVFVLLVQTLTGTGLSVSGGTGGINGWHFGSATPPVVGGATTPASNIVNLDQTIASGAQGTLVGVGANNIPLALGVPAVITIAIAEVTGGHAVAAIAEAATLFELP